MIQDPEADDLGATGGLTDLMGRAVEVPITPEVLRWAMKQTDVSISELAEATKTPSDRVKGWLKGDVRPNKGQFGRLVTKLKVSPDTLLLPKPPETEALRPQFRHPPSATGGRPLTDEERKQIRVAHRLHRVSIWINKQLQQKPRSLPDISSGTPAETAANLVREELRWNVQEQIAQLSASEATRLLRSWIQDLGILALQLPLREKGCRGFSFFNEWGSVAAVNTHYIEPARLFSYAHELGHLIRKTDSICTSYQDTALERWCESFAAAFLMPKDVVQAVARAKLKGRRATTVDDARKIASHFKVSVRAAALRVDELGLSNGTLFALVDWALDYRRKSGGGGGATRPVVRVREWGPLYTTLLGDAESQGLLRRHDVLEYLDVSNTELQEVRRLVASNMPEE